ncbi:MAG: hypothetical protein HC860_26775 [Alkalinema sp. RU_4_3]|nr:hypothetical protein [Alkalinema sp. RU_4_3]
MTGSKENTSLPKEVDTRVEPTAFEANSKQRCVLCDNDHYCYLFSAKDQIIKAVCHRTDHAPEGWDRTGTAKDGRGIFTKRGAPQTRKYFPGYITLTPKAIGGEQSWDAPFWRAPAPEWKDTGFQDSGGKEQVIYYEYPDPIDGHPLGRVERKQWSDRRKVYSYQGRKPKSKQITPQHWVGTPEAGDWKPKKGERVWPLYREMDKGFTLAYNRKIIESLLRAKGIRQASQKFHLNEDVSRAWERAKLTGNNQYLNPVETQSRQCFELPAELLKNHSENFEDENLDPLRSTRDLGGWDGLQTQSGLETLKCSEVDLLNYTQITQIHSAKNKVSMSTKIFREWIEWI